MKLKTAILQMRSENREYQKNTDIVIEKMAEASENGADILLLPEAFITGYGLPMDNDEALADDSVYLQQMCDAAKRLGIGVVATAFTKGKKKPQNSAIVIDKNGNVLWIRSEAIVSAKCLEIHTGRSMRITHCWRSTYGGRGVREDHLQCFRIIADGSGQDFDPVIAKTFLEMRDQVTEVVKKNR